MSAGSVTDSRAGRIRGTRGHRDGCLGVPEPHIERLPDGRWRVVVRCGCKRLREAGARIYRDLRHAENVLRRMAP